MSSFPVAGVQTRWLQLQQPYWTGRGRSGRQSNKIDGAWGPWKLRRCLSSSSAPLPALVSCHSELKPSQRTQSRADPPAGENHRLGQGHSHGRGQGRGERGGLGTGKSVPAPRYRKDGGSGQIHRRQCLSPAPPPADQPCGLSFLGAASS